MLIPISLRFIVLIAMISFSVVRTFHPIFQHQIARQYTRRGRRSPVFLQDALKDRSRKTSLSSTVSGIQQPLGHAGARPLKVQIFVDGTWLYYTMIQGRNGERNNNCPMTKKFGRRWQKTHSFVWNQLPQVIATQVSNQIQLQSGHSRPVEVVRTSMYTSLLEDTYLQGPRATMIDDWYRSNFEVHILKTPASQNNSTIQEKCIDIMIAVDMLYTATLPDAYDVAVLLTGDKDFIPALQKTRMVPKRVAIASVRNSCNKDLLRHDLNIRDFDTIWLEDHLDKLMVANGDRSPALQDLVVNFIKDSKDQQVPSRELGRYLQSARIEDDSTGALVSALPLLKRYYGSLRAFLAESDEFKICAIEDSVEYLVEYCEAGNDDGMMNMKDVGETYSDNSDMVDYGDRAVEIADNEPSETTRQESSLPPPPFSRSELQVEYGQLTVAKLKQRLADLGIESKARDTKPALIGLLIKHAEEESSRVHYDPKHGAHIEADENELVRKSRSSSSASSTGAVQSALPRAVKAVMSLGDETAVIDSIKTYIPTLADQSISSRMLGKFLESSGHLTPIKVRYGSLMKAVHAWAGRDPSMVVKHGPVPDEPKRQDFFISIDANE